MPYAMKLIRWANKRHRPTLACAGTYVEFVDVQMADKSDMWLVPTPSLREARLWNTVAEALETYQTVLQSDPVRPDGKPNRPLTAIHIELVEVQVRKEGKSKQET